MQRENKCNCYEIQNLPEEKIIIHLLGCEEDWETKEYDKLKGLKKFFTYNPRGYLKKWFTN